MCVCVCFAAGRRKVRERSEYHYFYEICSRKHFITIPCPDSAGARKGRERAASGQFWGTIILNNHHGPPHDLRTCSFQSSESCSAAPAFKAIGAKKMGALAQRHPAFTHLHVTFSSRNCLPLYVANCLPAF